MLAPLLGGWMLVIRERKNKNDFWFGVSASVNGGVISC